MKGEHMTFEELYDKVAQAYTKDDETEFKSIDLDRHPLLAITAYLLDDAFTVSEEEFLPINQLMWNALEEEINTFKRMQKVFE
ncbi:MAG: hypothetical protein ACXABY_02545 [Candidatus Thorarchaeota archaeon]|jgi:hypothetical protein